MNIFGIGPLEIVLILIVGILVLGPEGMVEAGRKLGKFMRRVVTSRWWRGMQDGVSEIQNLPYRLMREAELEELQDLRDLGKAELKELQEIKEQGTNALPDRKDLDPFQDTSWRGLNANPPRVPREEDAESEGDTEPTAEDNTSG